MTLDESKLPADCEVWTSGDCTLIRGDCLAVLPAVSGVDAVVTSPPYAMQRDYQCGPFDWDALMDSLVTFDPGNESCQMLINLGLIHREGECIPYWESWRERMRSAGWRFFGWYVWDQGSGLPGDWNGRLGPSHEFVFHFNRSAVRPNKTVSTKPNRVISGTGIRNRDGSTIKKSHDGRPVQPFKIPDSVIRVCREMSRTVKHPAKFPVQFAAHIVSAYTNEGDTVCDPFTGSGTTGVACVNLGRKFVGIEISPEYFEIARDRITKAQQAKAEQLVA